MLEYSHVECTVSIKHMIRDSQHGDISAVSLLMTATLLGRSRNLTLQLLQFFCKPVDKITDSLAKKVRSSQGLEQRIDIQRHGLIYQTGFLLLVTSFYIL